MHLRPRRFTSRTSPRQTARRAQWDTYRSGGGWWERRQQWIDTAANTHCPGCGNKVNGHDDVHHLHYPEIPGSETDEDLILLCRTCHDIVHNSIDNSYAWRRTDRRTATWAILKEIRQKNAL